MNAQCAACGRGGDGLKTCTSCKTAKYCGVDCQKAHRRAHKRECKRIAAQMFDEKLFAVPPKEECPICCLPFIPLNGTNLTSVYKECCGQVLCSGCVFMGDYSRDPSCPFCRAPAVGFQERVERISKRMEMNDPIAHYNRGLDYHGGANGFPRDLRKALQCWERAADLGSPDAHHALGVAYETDDLGLGVNLKKARDHYQLAALGGRVAARHNLARLELNGRNHNRAKKHFLIAAASGHQGSLDMLKSGFCSGIVTKAEFERALREYQDTVDEAKSDQRDEAARAVAEGYSILPSNAARKSYMHLAK